MLLTSFSVLALAVSSVSGLVIPRASNAPSNWSSSLEPYDNYHTRYLAIGCQNQHGNMDFFDRCCHPLSLCYAQVVQKYGAQPDSSCTSSSGTSGSDAGNEFDDGCDDSDVSEGDNSTPSPPQPSNAPETGEKIANVDASVTAGTGASSAGGFQSGGFATFFYQNGNAGACGQVHGDSDFIAAIDADRYGDTGRHSSLCGKRVQIINTKNNKSVTVTIADACPTCKNSNSIDLSVGAFTKIATEEEGEVPSEPSAQNP
ncbi:hypothetical protein AN958_09477 [Leucoagaricus sp. SymC.cos]|nr:hypothetical protein AN958_09477 [Leucoagaricus sp. SymC.cos]